MVLVYNNFAKFLFCSILLEFWLPTNVSSRLSNCSETCYIALSLADCQSENHCNHCCYTLETYVRSRCRNFCSTTIFYNGLHHTTRKCEFYPNVNYMSLSASITFLGSGTAEQVRISGVHFTFYNKL